MHHGHRGVDYVRLRTGGSRVKSNSLASGEANDEKTTDSFSVDRTRSHWLCQ